MDELSLSE
jgi:hypothetical protein